MGKMIFRLIALFLLICGNSEAMIEKVLLTIDGLTSPYSIIGVEEIVRPIPGVKNVQVWLASSQALVIWDIRKPFTPDAFINAFQNTPFQVTAITLDISGTIEPGDPMTLLSTPDFTQFIIDPKSKAFVEKLQNPFIIRAQVKQTDQGIVLFDVTSP